MKKQTIKLKESQLRQMIKEALNELDWKTYASAAWQRNHQTPSSTDAKGNKLNYRNHADRRNRSIELIDAARKNFNKKFGNGDYEAVFNQKPTTGFFNLNTRDKKHWYKQGYDDDYKLHTYPMGIDIDPNTVSDTAKQGNQEIDNFIQGNYDYTPDKGWHLKESQFVNMIKESVKKVLKEGVIKSREFLDKNENVCYGEDEMSFFAANYLRNEFRRFPNIAQAKACAQEMLQREKQRRASEMSGLRY